MRSPRRKRSLRRELIRDVDQKVLVALAQRATYVGSPEHKDVVSFVGQPKLRADASICDRVLARDKAIVQGWLRKSILAGSIGTPWEGDFPRYVWYRGGSTVYEGRLINREQGHYKGYPLTEDEWPAGVCNGNGSF